MTKFESTSATIKEARPVNEFRAFESLLKLPELHFQHLMFLFPFNCYYCFAHFLYSCYNTCYLAVSTSLQLTVIAKCTAILVYLKFLFKGRVHCYSMQFVMNKCFLLNPEKNLAQIRLVIFEKNAPLFPKNDVTEPKASYSNNQLKNC